MLLKVYILACNFIGYVNTGSFYDYVCICYYCYLDDNAVTSHQFRVVVPFNLESIKVICFFTDIRNGS